ncbi:MAG: branched-chain amino acid ABC transporter permease [Xanthobacteraceae bacterium]
MNANRVAILALIVVIAGVPLFGNAAAESILSLIGIYVIVTVGLNLLVGFAGKISFGHTAFMTLGAYASGILTTTYSWPPLAALVAGTIGTGAIAWVIGMQVLRLRGHYLAMVTLALGIVVFSVSTRWTEVTGGLTGIVGLPNFSIAGYPFDTKLQMYYLIWFVAIVLFLLSFRIVYSRFGRSVRALGADEVAASAVGVPVVRRRNQIFVLSAMYASIAGSLYAHYLNYANATFFDFTMTVHLIAILVVGGIGMLWGPILGSIVLVGVSQNLGSYGDYSLLIFGLLYGAALLIMPRGIAGELSRFFGQLSSVKLGQDVADRPQTHTKP